MNCKITALLFLLILFLLCIPKAKAQKKDAEILLQKGIQDYNDLEFQSSIQSLKKAINLELPDKSKVEAYKYLGFAYIVQEDIPKAKEMFKKLLEIQPDYQLSSEISPKLYRVFNEVKSEFKPKVRTGSIFIKSVPADASIYINEKLQSKKTPAVIENVKADSYSIKLSLEGYEDWEKTVTVKANQMTEISGTLDKIKPVKKTGDIFIQSEPSRAEIYLDEVPQKSKTPATIESITSGIHSIRLSKLGYQEWKQKINVEAGKTNRLSANLIPIPEKNQTKFQQPPEIKKGSNLKWYLLGGTVAAVGGGVSAFFLTRDSGDSDDNSQTKSLTISISVP